MVISIIVVEDISKLFSSSVRTLFRSKAKFTMFDNGVARLANLDPR